MNLNLDYIEKFGIDVSANVQNIIKLATSINGSMEMSAEATCIDNIYLEFNVIGKKSVETRTYNWARLGELLVHLQEKYNTTPGINRVAVSWSKFSSQHFKNFGKRRREEAALLYKYGPSIEKFYFLGIDQILYAFNNLRNLKSSNKNMLKTIKNMFNFSSNDPIDTDEEKNIFRTKIKNMCEFGKSFEQVEQYGANIDLYYKCISVGCIVNGDVLKSLHQLENKTQDEKDEYFYKAIANRSFSESDEKSKTYTYKGSCGLMCKIIDNVKKYKTNPELIPKKFNRTTLEDTINELKWLKENIK